MKNMDKNMKFLFQNHDKLVLGVSLWLLGRPLGPQGRQRRKSEPQGGSLDPPPSLRRDPKVGLKWALFFWSLRDTKKGGPGRPSKTEPFFGRCWGLLGGPQEGSRLDGSSIFPFAAGPKRAPKWEPKWSLLGSQIRTILTLGHHLGEIGAQKAASKNECRIWGVPGGGLKYTLQVGPRGGGRGRGFPSFEGLKD